MLPSFEALSEERLLFKCLQGGTQNQNEAINGLIWQRATKETYSSMPTVDDGSASVLTYVLKELDIIPGRHSKTACAKLESDRIRHSRRKNTTEKLEERLF